MAKKQTDPDPVDPEPAAPEVENDVPGAPGGDGQPMPVFEPPPITGYRSLTGDEVARVNAFKAKEIEALALVDAAALSANGPRQYAELLEARKNITQGFMLAVRALTEPKAEG